MALHGRARTPDAHLSASASVNIELLRDTLANIGPVVVAFSGGADSSLVAWAANDVLGDKALCVTAVSPSLATDEERDCFALAREWGLRWRTVCTDEMSDAAYRANDTDRCFWCKSALMDALEPLAAKQKATVVLGVNVDDLGDHRPGQQAAAGRGARFPLVEAGFTKDAVRQVSKKLGLRTWDKPAAACLASRIPYGTAVSVPLLDRLDRAEAALRQLGFGQLRVRHYDETARIELPTDDLAVAVARRAELVAAVKGVGYRYVTLDLEGFRSGNLNDALGHHRPDDSPDDSGNGEGVLAELAERLAADTVAALGSWVSRCVAQACERAEGMQLPPAGDTAAAAEQCTAEIGSQIVTLLQLDATAQRSTPLEIVRGAVRFPTAVLRRAGVPTAQRDAFSEERFPDDPYDLTPASLADINPELGPLAMAWGAAKALELAPQEPRSPQERIPPPKAQNRAAL